MLFSFPFRDQSKNSTEKYHKIHSNKMLIELSRFIFILWLSFSVWQQQKCLNEISLKLRPFYCPSFALFVHVLVHSTNGEKCVAIYEKLNEKKISRFFDCLLARFSRSHFELPNDDRNGYNRRKPKWLHSPESQQNESLVIVCETAKFNHVKTTFAWTKEKNTRKIRRKKKRATHNL